MRKVRSAIMGGTGTEGMLDAAEHVRIGTRMPGTLLAREPEICYATVCIVINMAAGLEKHLATRELVKTARRTAPVLKQVLRETALHLREERHCPCAHALKEARFQG